MDDQTFQRFSAKVFNDPATGCWIWTAFTQKSGYGRLRVGSRTNNTMRVELAHRLSYEHFRGPIPPGLCVLHNCPTGDNPSCVNPAHLWLGTKTENGADKALKGRAPKGSKNPRAKLTESDVREIRRLLQESDLTQKQIGWRFGVGFTCINKIHHNETWTHVK